MYNLLYDTSIVSIKKPQSRLNKIKPQRPKMLFVEHISEPAKQASNCRLSSWRTTVEQKKIYMLYIKYILLTIYSSQICKKISWKGNIVCNKQQQNNLYCERKIYFYFENGESILQGFSCTTTVMWNITLFYYFSNPGC